MDAHSLRQCPKRRRELVGSRGEKDEGRRRIPASNGIKSVFHVKLICLQWANKVILRFVKSEGGRAEGGGGAA